MALNPFFLQGSGNEQFLVQDLINEQLKIFGIDVYYIPRKLITTDNILGEVQSSKFDDSFLIEAYLNNYEGYAPDSDIMTKFGLRLKNEISLTISKERYQEFIAPFLVAIEEGLSDTSQSGFDLGNLVDRPKEGDLIWFPLGERLFEIKRVEHEKPFYQLNKNYTYELQCELYEYENEEINTSIDLIDKSVEDEGYITTVRLVGLAVTATATAGITSGSISEIFLNNDGSGYSSAPTITFSEPPVGGLRATAVAITTSRANVQSIKRIEITNAGFGYTEAPTITFSGGSGTGAAATCSIGGTQFSVSILNITNSGKGYPTPPVVTIEGPTGAGVTATGVAVVNQDSITALRILTPGIGYTEAPSVSFTGFTTVGVGTFVYNEEVTGQTSGTKAIVKGFKIDTATDAVNPPILLDVSINSGEFSAGETIVGSSSLAKYVVRSHDMNSDGDTYDENEEFELEADTILDFTEINPFGEY